MFLNFDCVEGRQKVYEDSVRVLCTLAQGQRLSSEAVSKKAQLQGVVCRGWWREEGRLWRQAAARKLRHALCFQRKSVHMI
jgi:hypothetical protein